LTGVILFVIYFIMFNVNKVMKSEEIIPGDMLYPGVITALTLLCGYYYMVYVDCMHDGTKKYKIIEPEEYYHMTKYV